MVVILLCNVLHHKSTKLLAWRREACESSRRVFVQWRFSLRILVSVWMLVINLHVKQLDTILQVVTIDFKHATDTFRVFIHLRLRRLPSLVFQALGEVFFWNGFGVQIFFSQGVWSLGPRVFWGEETKQGSAFNLGLMTHVYLGLISLPVFRSSFNQWLTG